MNPVIRHVLPNGLTVLLQEQHSAPVASAWTFYRVGARNEAPGITGVSHWCEHMLFKGTPRYGKGVIDILTAKNGGFNNGLTDLDYTCYLFTLPAERIGIALDLLSDLMANATFDPAEVESERSVIIAEREGHENHPAYQLLEEVNATAFHVHPYRNGVIGWKSDLQAITRDDLYGHYRRYYAPDNAIVVVAGDFLPDAMLQTVEAHFGAHAAAGSPPPVRPVEPPQESERRIYVEKSGTTAYFRTVYHTPAVDHADTPALIALDAILSGGKGMSFFGGSVALYKSSRLYRALVETELAADISSSYSLNRDPGLFDITATVREGRTLRALEQAVFAEVDRIAGKPPAAAELQKAVKQTRAQYAYAAERVTSRAYLLGMLECLHAHEDTALFTDRLAEVTPRDVQRVANTYLSKYNRTVGWFQPK